MYDKGFRSTEGRPPISGRVIIGAMIIKHLEALTDRDTIQHIVENMYMQYFLGYSSFTDEAPFTAPLFVSIRKRMSLALINQINEVVIQHCQSDREGSDAEYPPDEAGQVEPPQKSSVREEIQQASPASDEEPLRKGCLLIDATIAPQTITFPTDLKLLDAARRKSEQLVDMLYNRELHGAVKSRTYRRIARRDFLNTSKKKAKNSKQIYKGNGQQIRNIFW